HVRGRLQRGAARREPLRPEDRRRDALRARRAGRGRARAGADRDARRRGRLRAGVRPRRRRRHRLGLRPDRAVRAGELRVYDVTEANDWNLTLHEALPYIPRFTGQVIVVKLGGSALGSHDTTLEDIAVLRSLGARPGLVHGGGAAISEWMRRGGVEPRFVNGLRVTDEPTLEIVTMVLGGKINKQLVVELARHGCPAIGLSGADGPILRAG